MRCGMQCRKERAIDLARLLLLLLSIAVLGACGEARIVQRDDSVPSRRAAAMHPIAGRGEYVVVRGDTLYGIAFRNGMDFRELAAINSIESPYTIYVDQLLRLRGEHVRMARHPSSPTVTSNPPPSPSTSVHIVRVEPLPDTRPAPSTTAPVARPPVAAASQPPAPISVPTAQTLPVPAHPTAPSAAVIPAVTAPLGGIGWRWPVKGSVIDHFMAGDATHQGVDIAGNDGDPVLAAADGVVVYSGSGLVGYGELIIIKHSDEWLSAYGHNRKRWVQEGQRVKAGQQIAEMGRTGSNRDMLHFEIRRNGRPVDPQQYLPQR
jgi:lipoprotein NlpD